MIRFSEVVSALSPSEYAQLALILFLFVFVAVAIREGRKPRARAHAAWARMPLEDDAVPVTAPAPRRESP